MSIPFSGYISFPGGELPPGSFSGTFSPSASPPAPALNPPDAYYALDGNLQDGSGHGHHLTDLGTAAFDTVKFGQGLVELTGETASGGALENQTVFAAGLIRERALSIAFWANLGADGFFPVLCVEPDFSATAFMLAGGLSGGGVWIGGDFFPVVGAFGGDQIKHYAFVFTPNQLKFYESGILQDTVDISAATGAFTGTMKLIVRVTGGVGRSLDDVYLVDAYALTQDEVTDLAAGTQSAAQLAGL